MKVLVVYESDNGQAEKVARCLLDTLFAAGHLAQLSRASERPRLDGQQAVLVGGSVRMGKHQKALVAWCRDNRDALLKLPNAFFSVSVSARRRFGTSRGEVAKILSRFIAATGWVPDRLWPFAGALKYTRYPFHIRAMLVLIARMTGGDTDTSRDFEYTDWDAVRAAGRDFARALTYHVQDGARAAAGLRAPLRS